MSGPLVFLGLGGLLDGRVVLPFDFSALAFDQLVIDVDQFGGKHFVLEEFVGTEVAGERSDLLSVGLVLGVVNFNLLEVVENGSILLAVVLLAYICRS